MAKVFTITEGLENMGAMKTGGQGSVYKGKRIGQIITAIKLLPTPIHSETADDKNYIGFQNEVQKLKKVNEEPNPNVVKILSSGITDSGNFPFIEMEYIEGPDLEDLLKPPHSPIFTIKEVLKIADQLSHALAHCHKVGVRHGDIKSNNVKYNVHTGNYVLLDFGLAVMSDEQRRTSLRHAGAIEFMAPEQNEGQMLFQTDVYSFGVVLFELLAGTVPFPLKDKGETSRNLVMVSHMETPPPAILPLRERVLPAGWSTDKKEQEMNVPDWLIRVIYKCLQKKPEDRFSNGVELYEYIWQNSIKTVNHLNGNGGQLYLLQEENRKLRAEKEQLQQQLLQYQQNNTKPPNTKSAETPQPTYTTVTEDPGAYAQYAASSNWLTFKNILLILMVGGALATAIYFFVIKPTTTPNEKVADTSIKPTEEKKVIGEYKVITPRAYFYTLPDEATRRNAYAVPSDDIVKANQDKGGFIYTEITNPLGQISKGWLRKQDLATLEEWNNRKPAINTPPVVDVSIELNEARVFLNSNETERALKIYKTLSQQQVPEAMYEYANLALQNRNPDIDCGEAFNLLINTSNKGYPLARRTLGFLYSFADDEAMLQQFNYGRCNYPVNITKGAKLLMEAVVQGDTTASQLLDQLNLKSKQGTSQQQPQQ